MHALYFVAKAFVSYLFIKFDKVKRSKKRIIGINTGKTGFKVQSNKNFISTICKSHKNTQKQREAQ